MQTKFSGRPRQQSKPPVCKKSIQRPQGIPELPSTLNVRLGIVGEDSSGLPLNIQRAATAYYDPNIATHYIATWEQGGGRYQINIFPFQPIDQIGFTVVRAPQPIGGTWSTSGTHEKGGKKSPFDIGSFAIVAELGSGFGSLSVNY